MEFPQVRAPTVCKLTYILSGISNDTVSLRLWCDLNPKIASQLFIINNSMERGQQPGFYSRDGWLYCVTMQ